MKIYSRNHRDYPEAPSDWDGGKVKLRDGSFTMYDPHQLSPRWTRGKKKWPDEIVGYTAKVDA